MTSTITIKLYPSEYSLLYTHLEHIEANTSQLRLNSSIGHLVLAAFFHRKRETIKSNALSNKGKIRSISFKALEAVALYHELAPFSRHHVLIRQLFGHLDRALVNAGMNNKIYL